MPIIELPPACARARAPPRPPVRRGPPHRCREGSGRATGATTSCGRRAGPFLRPRRRVHVLLVTPSLVGERDERHVGVTFSGHARAVKCVSTRSAGRGARSPLPRFSPQPRWRRSHPPAGGVVASSGRAGGPGGRRAGQEVCLVRPARRGGPARRARQAGGQARRGPRRCWTAASRCWRPRSCRRCRAPAPGVARG
jgi:hypothetical protein